ncbi:MAG: hypothetical protein GY719_00805 [bacterium]|nr:hypothetical protein [bacterium]
MPLPVPDLDDRSFDQLAAEARALVPRYFPAWTDHNPSDPGITLLELFAFLIESSLYRIDRIPEQTLERFAALVGVERQADEAIEQTLARALESLRSFPRAVTAADLERWALETDPGGGVARATAVVTSDALDSAPRIEVVIVPSDGDPAAPVPTADLRQAVFAFLRPRCLVATRLRVVAPDYTPVSLTVTVALDPRAGAGRGEVELEVESRLRDFLSPLDGGKDETGWEFGRPVYRSELYQRIEGVDGVDHVRKLLLNDDESLGSIQLVSATSLVELRDLEVAATID